MEFTKKHYAGLAGLVISIGWIAYVVMSNNKQANDIAALKKKADEHEKKLAEMLPGWNAATIPDVSAGAMAMKSSDNQMQDVHAGFSNFVVQPETIPRVYGAPPGSVESYRTDEDQTIGNPNLLIEKVGGQIIISSLNG